MLGDGVGCLGVELVLGREDFKDRVEQMLKRQTRPGQPGQPRIEEPATIYTVISHISEICELTPIFLN